MTWRGVQEAPVSPADIAAKLRQIGGEVTDTAEEARGSVVVVAAVAVVALVGVALVGVAYLLGRRRGRRRSTVVEIRRA